MNTMSQKLDLRQAQQLVMTPQLQQAIKLLQLNNVELGAFIEEELEKNPLLEKVDTSAEGTDLDGDALDSSAHEEKDDVDAAFEAAGQSDDFDAGSSMADMGAGGSTAFDISDESFESRMSAEKSLREHLTDQIHMAFSDERDCAVGALLLDRLDSSGYIREDLSMLAERFGCSVERIERVLARMKQFDPTGICACSLEECMMLQLEERGQLDAPMRILLDNLQHIANHDFGTLAEICGVNETYLTDMVDEIRALNPKPAALFDHFVVQTAVPDVLMRRQPKHLGGGWRVELNNETLPRVLVNQDYYTHVMEGATGKTDREYVTAQLASASWLVKALDQRAQTILKVAAEIVEQQDAFFNYGIEFLRPMTLKDVAGVVDVHESTVSRVTSNKYIGTPRGVFELKFFFSSGVVSDSGVAHSAQAVKARIKTLIDDEKPNDILSDDKIVDILKGEGIDIARRTVAKYREALKIASSVQRRKQKKHLA